MRLPEPIQRLLLAIASPTAFRVKRGLRYDDHDRGLADVYLPKRALEGRPICVFLYGGSWDSGDRTFYRFVGATFASAGITTVIPDYSVHPAGAWPDFLHDNAAAVRWARDHAEAWGADPERLYLIGQSAGAYNGAMLCLDPRFLGAVNLEPVRDIAGMVGLAGPYDFLPLQSEKLKAVFGEEGQKPEHQPINLARADAPPMLLMVGGEDRVIRPGNTRRLAQKIAASGGRAEEHIFPGLDHQGSILAILPLLRKRAPVFEKIMAFMAETGPGARSTAT